MMRSLLFVPGSRPDRIAKALQAGADAVCVDLEDAVAPDRKAEARSAVAEILAETGGFGVRVNAVSTEWGEADCAAIRDLSPDFVMIPKADRPVDVAAVRSLFGEADAPPLLPIIESAEGLKNAWDTAMEAGILAVMFGGGDLSADLGVSMDWEPLLFARSQVVAAAARARVWAMDVPFIDVANEDGLVAETARARALGYRAKACIHPRQVAAVNAGFTPSQDEIDSARAVLDAFRAAAGGVALHNGKLIEKPIVLAAERVLDAARAAGLEKE